MSRFEVASAAAMRDLGWSLAQLLQAGDLVLLIGSLGAGKTTLAQGVGAGLGIRGEVTSPTFVIARVHPPLDGGPAMVHADLYRLGGKLELDDLDLDASIQSSITVVEWGEGMAESLAEDRLEVLIERDVADAAEDGVDVRVVHLRGIGSRWAGVDLGGLRRGA